MYFSSFRSVSNTPNVRYECTLSAHDFQSFPPAISGRTRVVSSHFLWIQVYTRLQFFISFTYPDASNIDCIFKSYLEPAEPMLYAMQSVAYPKHNSPRFFVESTWGKTSVSVLVSFFTPDQSHECHPMKLHCLRLSQTLSVRGTVTKSFSHN